MPLLDTDSESESFKKLQYAFTRHMRDPKNVPPPDDIEPRRVAIYADLIYRNIEGFIAQNFPVLRRIIHDDDWHDMLRDYIKRHISHTPYFPKMPLEFLHYLEKERNDPKAPEFHFELAHYEWVETALMLDQREISMNGIDPHGELLQGIPKINPLLMPLVYQWPVHRISPDYIPTAKPEQPTYLLVYRDQKYHIGFMELNVVSAKLIEELIKNDDRRRSGQEILGLITNALQHPSPETVMSGGLKMMQEFKQKDILLGTIL